MKDRPRLQAGPIFQCPKFGYANDVVLETMRVSINALFAVRLDGKKRMLYEDPSFFNVLM